MTYLTITKDDQQKAILDAIAGREQELFGYDLNIANYTALLEGLPIGAVPQHITEAPVLDEPFETALLRSEYQFRNEIAARLTAEKIERSKSHRIYTVLLAQLKN